ncbi:hypothetical protein [Desertimonas flava]|uniref:hypothetical protein n=1 Tax=Desertimonas flava TaxID=2064846 RepID=UPI0023F1F92F|nr:hypothetical protein [Desertimonas flava]
MRRHSLVAGLLTVAVPLVGAAASAAPPDSDAAADEALRSFEAFADDEGIEIESPTCAEAGDPETFVCYALTTDGVPFVAQASLADDEVEWQVLSGPQPAPDETAGPESSAPATSVPAAPSEPDGSVTDDSVTDDSVTEEPDSLSFFHGVFSADPEQTAAAIELTQPGSPAEAYARFQNLFVTVAAEYGVEISAGSVFLTTDAVRVCVTASECSEISDIEVADGQVVSFAVDGNQIGGRLATMGETVVAATTAFRLAVAYQTVTGEQLAAYVELASEQGDVIDLQTAVYVGADGSQIPVAVGRSLGLDTTKLKGNQMAYLAFPGAAPGGEIHVTVTPADGSPAVVAVIPVDAIAP